MKEIEIIFPHGLHQRRWVYLGEPEWEWMREPHSLKKRIAISLAFSLLFALLVNVMFLVIAKREDYSFFIMIFLYMFLVVVIFQTLYAFANYTLLNALRFNSLFIVPTVLYSLAFIGADLLTYFLLSHIDTVNIRMDRMRPKDFGGILYFAYPIVPAIFFLSCLKQFFYPPTK